MDRNGPLQSLGLVSARWSSVDMLIVRAKRWVGLTADGVGLSPVETAMMAGFVGRWRIFSRS